MPGPQFTLRSLLVAMLVVGAAFAWVAHNLHIVRERRAMLDQDSGRLFIVGGIVEAPADLPWIRRILGDEPIAALYDDLAEPEREQVQRLRRVFPEAKILVRADQEMKEAKWIYLRPVLDAR